MTDPDCLFCRIVAGEIPATVVRQDEQTIAFRDLNPVAPTHVLVVPRAHYPDLAATTAADPDLAGAVCAAAADVARLEGLTNGWRLVFNTGADGGQTVGHLHGHVLGGRAMTWPPG